MRSGTSRYKKFAAILLGHHRDDDDLHFPARALAGKGTGGTLVSPIVGEMTGKINESMQATIEVELLGNRRRIFEGTGRNAGLEVAGAVEIL